MNLDGTSVVRVTNHAASDVCPGWSPDGIHIVFASDRGGHFDIYKMDSNGGSVTPLTTNPAYDSQPCW
jgi:Tol biopolymer transport system component